MREEIFAESSHVASERKCVESSEFFIKRDIVSLAYMSVVGMSGDLLTSDASSHEMKLRGVHVNTLIKN